MQVQALVLLCRQLDLNPAEAQALPAAVKEELQNARRSAESVIERLRDFARTLRPPTLEDLGMVTAMRWLAVDLEERAHMEVRFQVSGRGRRLAPEVELGIFRSAQEALRNVERHAEARRVSLCIGFAGDGVHLSVEDDGVGFMVANLQDPANDQLGLLGMQERAEALGGVLEISSSPGRGTSISLAVPGSDGVGSPEAQRLAE